MCEKPPSAARATGKVGDHRGGRLLETTVCKRPLTAARAIGINVRTMGDLRGPWETTACQRAPAAASATGKVGDHERKTIGDHSVPESAD